MLAIDADSHFVEPLDLYEKYIDPQFRDRAFKVQTNPTTGLRQMVVDNKALQLLDVEELLSAISGYGQKESGHDLSNFDRELPYSAEWEDMNKRIKFLDQEGFAAQVIYPTAGLLWEDSVSDPVLADALCRAYNTWALELGRLAEGPAVSGGPSVAARSGARGARTAARGQTGVPFGFRRRGTP